MSLQGLNVVVTGATRGIGRGLALGFAELGANVYITGRNESSGPYSLKAISQLITDIGSNCHYFVVDHSDDASVEHFFRQLNETLQSNQSNLDVFVNNAYSAVNFLDATLDIPFWEKNVEDPNTRNANADPGKVWDIINGVGLRNAFICATRAIRVMERQKKGIMVNITSWGGIMSLFDPVYSVGKEALDRLSAEIGKAAPEGVMCIGFCPGYVMTENMEVFRQAENEKKMRGEDIPIVTSKLPSWNAQTTLFVGRVLGMLMTEKGEKLRQSMNGKVVMASEVAEILDVRDENGFRALSFRSVRFALMNQIAFLRESPLRYLIPRRLYAPWWVIRSFSGATQYWSD